MTEVPPSREATARRAEVSGQWSVVSGQWSVVKTVGRSKGVKRIGDVASLGNRRIYRDSGRKGAGTRDYGPGTTDHGLRDHKVGGLLSRGPMPGSPWSRPRPKGVWRSRRRRFAILSDFGLGHWTASPREFRHALLNPASSHPAFPNPLSSLLDYEGPGLRQREPGRISSAVPDAHDHNHSPGLVDLIVDQEVAV